MPVFDEEARVVRGIETLMADVDRLGVDAEVLIVDDGSRDATPRLVEELCARFDRARAITLPRNQGKGAAVRSGMGAATIIERV